MTANILENPEKELQHIILQLLEPLIKIKFWSTPPRDYDEAADVTRITRKVGTAKITIELYDDDYARILYNNEKVLEWSYYDDFDDALWTLYLATINRPQLSRMQILREINFVLVDLHKKIISWLSS